MKLFLVWLSCLCMTACTSSPVGNVHVPEPEKAVNLSKYTGLWYEVARYENRFEKKCEGVTAEYIPRADKQISVINTCHKNTVDGPIDVAHGAAKIVEGSHNAKLRVSFFWPFYGDYWVLDHAEDYSWSIVGEPSGEYLWILSRKAVLSDKQMKSLVNKAHTLGYDTSLLYLTKQK